MTDRISDVVARLQAVADDLADLTLDRLREAATGEGDATALAAEERRLTRARRAVDKAIAVLSVGNDGEAD